MYILFFLIFFYQTTSEDVMVTLVPNLLHQDNSLNQRLQSKRLRFKGDALEIYLFLKLIRLSTLIKKKTKCV